MMNEIIGKMTGILDAFARGCGSADLARRIILVITIVIILKEARGYFRTHSKVKILLIVAAQMTGCGINCYYKPSKLPLMVPITALAVILLWLAFTGRGNIPTGRTGRKGGRRE